MKKYRDQVIKIQSSYVLAHSKLNELTEQIKKIDEIRQVLLEQLTQVREEERDLINNLEKELGREVTADDFQKIISSDNDVYLNNN
jgi:DNA-binding ferritin-like protein